MTSYKKKPIKTTANTVVQAVAQNLDKIIPPLSQKWPNLSNAFTGLGYALNLQLIYHQESLNTFVEDFMMKVDLNKLEIDYESDEFRDAFVIAVEQYFKLRLEQKREVAKVIFVECVKSPAMPQFPLERLNNILQLISLEGLKYLAFLEKEITPIKDNAINFKLDSGNYPPPPQGKSREWWYERLERTEPISKYVSDWLKTYEPPELAKITEAIAEKREELKQIKTDELYENATEMEQLGLMHNTIAGSQGWSVNTGGGSNLSRFGRAFVGYVAQCDLNTRAGK